MTNLLVTLASFLLISSPIITRHDTDQEAHLADAKAYDFVVQLKLMDATGWVVNEGTFIKKDWIITAAHGLTSVEPNQSIQFHGKDYNVSQVVIHPDWDGENNDIALIQLDKPADINQTASMYKQTDEIGKEILLVGHGWSGDGLTGPLKDDGVFRMATNRVDSVSKEYIKFRFDSPDDANVTPMEGISGPGDSGGPAFIKTKKGLHLVGISSHQLNKQIGLTEGVYGVIEYYSRVSSYNDWIENVITGKYKESTLNTDYSNNDWGFKEGVISERATKIMNAIVSKNVTEDLIKNNFTSSFQSSTDLNGFLTTISDVLENPTIIKFKKMKSHVLSFTVEASSNKVYFIQFDAEKRSNYLIGGMVVKKVD